MSTSGTARPTRRGTIDPLMGQRPAPPPTPRTCRAPGPGQPRTIKETHGTYQEGRQLHQHVSAPAAGGDGTTGGDWLGRNADSVLLSAAADAACCSSIDRLGVQ
jgi:hypothetical protein